PVSVTFEFIRDAGSTGTPIQTVTIAPGELFHRTTESIFKLSFASLQTRWVRVVTASDSLEGFQVFLAAAPGGVTALPGRKTVATRLMLSHIAEQTGATFVPTDLFTGLAVLNPSDQTVTGTILIVTAAGIQLGSYDLSLSPHQKRSLLLREMIIEALGETSGTVWIRPAPEFMCCRFSETGISDFCRRYPC